MDPSIVPNTLTKFMRGENQVPKHASEHGKKRTLSSEREVAEKKMKIDHHFAERDSTKDNCHSRANQQSNSIVRIEEFVHADGNIS